MYKSKRRPDENEAGNVALRPTYSDFKSRHEVRSLRNHLRYRDFRPDFPEMNIHNTPWWKKESCTKTHCQTLNMWIISLMRLLGMCPMTSFRRLEAVHGVPSKSSILDGRGLSWSHYEISCFYRARHDRERCWERFAYPNLRRFQVTSWSAEPDDAIQAYYTHFGVNWFSH